MSSFAKGGATRASAVRALMRSRGLDALLVPHVDPHNSEYFAPKFERRRWLTGFTGSAGDALVTNREGEGSALLFTDGRYWLQAKQELFGGWDLVRDGEAGVKSIDEHIACAASGIKRLGVDPFLVSAGRWRKLAAIPHVELCATDVNLVDEAMKAEESSDFLQGQEGGQCAPIIVHGEEFSGESPTSKISRTRRELKNIGADNLFISTLDDVAWLLNLRGEDVPYTPIFLAYVWLSMDSTILFVDESKLTEETRTHLSKHNVDVADYDSVSSFLASRNAAGSKVCLDVSSSSFAIVDALNACTIIEKESPTTKMKSIKNEVELAGIRACHVRDGLAKTRFLFWLEDEVASGAQLDEHSAAEKLEAFRSANKHFAGLSFPSISAADASGALLHYHVDPAHARPITRDSMYLIDSGAQYYDGTTDVTRTIHFGEPTDFQREAFTRVLKGFIAVHAQKFPAGTTIGPQLDGLARQHLWNAGLDYAHGTGHGVGHCLCVHERPPSISGSKRALAARTPTPFHEGMIVTDEPGYYDEANAFGIRIENVLITVDAGSGRGASASTSFLGFESATLVPLQRKLIDASLLAPHEVTFIDAYHQKVYAALAEEAAASGDVDDIFLEKLKIATAPL